jgi:adenine specific DNA methylase Mod
LPALKHTIFKWKRQYDEVNFNRDENGLIKDNLIIKGNNLLALHTLKSNFAGKVKLIYIDPPYNTGNDSFNYNDQSLNGKDNTTSLISLMCLLDIVKPTLLTNLV